MASKKEKVRYIECAHHKVQVSFVTKQTLRRLSKAKKDENVYGLHDSSINKIYIQKGLDDHKTKHTLLHELYHAFDYQTSGLDEEIKADAFATMLMRLILKPWQELLSDDDNN
jgi:hypothetical protein